MKAINVSDPPETGLKAALARKASPLHTMRAVFWSFFGVRRSADHAQDLQNLNPAHVVIAGLIGAGLFIAALVLLVRFVISSGVAA